MDRLRHKQKKDKPNKNLDNEKTHSFIKDVQKNQERLKIKGLLRTVRMNHSMRVAHISKVTNSKDFNDQEFHMDEELNSTEGHQIIEPLSATNPVMVPSTYNDSNVTESQHIILKYNEIYSELNDDDSAENTNNIINKTSKDQEESLKDTQYNDRTPKENPDSEIQKDPENKKILLVKGRDRKLSLDQTMLTRRISQSELDLHSIGKSPLERKSSFFKKKMDSFLKNTTEIFKRQSLSNKVELDRPRGCMSVSLQSLNEKTGDLLKKNQVSKLLGNIFFAPHNIIFFSLCSSLFIILLSKVSKHISVI